MEVEMIKNEMKREIKHSHLKISFDTLFQMEGNKELLHVRPFRNKFLI